MAARIIIFHIHDLLRVGFSLKTTKPPIKGSIWSGIQMMHAKYMTKLAELTCVSKFAFLQLLVDNNEIAELAPNTFTDLENLTLVNLTNNKIEKFPLNALSLNTKHNEGK